MKPVQALLPMSRTNGAPRSACRARAAATICCDRPGKPWVLDDETISASSPDHASPAIRRSSSSRPTVTGDSSGSKKRLARSPVFLSINSERSRTLATMAWAASSSSLDIGDQALADLAIGDHRVGQRAGGSDDQYGFGHTCSSEREVHRQ